jgi:hypothetical protein
LYASATAAFSSTNSLRVGRVDFTATLLRNGSILIAGGTTNDSAGQSEVLATAALYQPGG